MTDQMTREDVIREIDRIIGRFPECKFRTKVEAAKAAGVTPVYFGRVMLSDTMPIPEGMLRIAGLVAENHPTTYRRKV